MAHPLLEIRDVHKSYDDGTGRVEVLKGIELEINAGEIVFVMGPSGVGKSTLLNLIGTLDQPTRGEILIDGNETARLKERALSRFRNDNFGFIFQFHHLLPDFTAMENVMMPHLIRGGNMAEGGERAAQLLTDVGLGERLTHRPNQLSGGEQQRVAIARALMNQPRLILADEPTGDLDRANSRSLFDLIRRLNDQFGQTFIIVSHDEMLASEANNIVHLADGKVASQERKG